MVVKIPLPPRSYAIDTGDQEANEALIRKITDASHERYADTVNACLAKVPPRKLQALNEEVIENGYRPDEFMPRLLDTMVNAYIALRTDLLVIGERQDDATESNKAGGVFSNMSTLLANSVGRHMATEIIKDVTYSVDEVLEERYGEGQKR